MPRPAGSRRSSATRRRRSTSTHAPGSISTPRACSRRKAATATPVACSSAHWISPAKARFAREARLASTLRHPSLVEVYDVSIERGFLVMEFLPGGSLAQRLAAGERLASPQVRRMTLDLVAGLEAAHHRGVVHRDVK